MNHGDTRIQEAARILTAVGLPPAQCNERSALCLLALLNMTPDKAWSAAENPLMGVTPIMHWVGRHYGKHYAPNTRETFRRQTLHQFCAAGIALYNPDRPERPVNSPKTVYQVAPAFLKLVRLWGTPDWQNALHAYLAERETLVARYAREREQHRVPVRTSDGNELMLSPGKHSELLHAIIEDFAPRFAPGSRLVYVGDTGGKWVYFDRLLLSSLGVEVDAHGKMPDVVVYYEAKHWLILVEAVTSHGPVDQKRHEELETLFSKSTAALVYVTAFPTRTLMSRYLTALAWETDVWVADSPSHLIHFDGERFLGPYAP